MSYVHDDLESGGNDFKFIQHEQNSPFFHMHIIMVYYPLLLDVFFCVCSKKNPTLNHWIEKKVKSKDWHLWYGRRFTSGVQ